MGELKYDFTRPEVLWGHTDILGADLEKIEYDKNFAGEENIYISILDDVPVYHSLMNFPEEPEDAINTNISEEEDDSVGVDSDDDSADRNSYRDTDQDNVYYLI